MTRTGYQLNDIGGALSWSALNSFIKGLKSDSAVARELGHATGWEDTIKTNAILADIYDLLQVINANICGLSGNKKKSIKTYPRPYDKEDKRKIGKGALPFTALCEWIDSKRRR